MVRRMLLRFSRTHSTAPLLRLSVLAALCFGVLAAVPAGASAASAAPVASYSFDEGSGETFILTLFALPRRLSPGQGFDPLAFEH